MLSSKKIIQAVMVITSLMLFSIYVSAATLVTNSDGKLIGLNNVNVTGYGFYDATFSDLWQGGVYTMDFVTQSTQALLIDTDLQGTVFDYNPDTAVGCEATNWCLWATGRPGMALPGTQIFGLFVNHQQSEDHFDKFIPGHHLFLSDVLSTGFSDTTFLEWTPSNVSAVPVPAAVFLFAPALLGFLGFRRRAKNSVA